MKVSSYDKSPKIKVEVPIAIITPVVTVSVFLENIFENKSFIPFGISYYIGIFAEV